MEDNRKKLLNIAIDGPSGSGKSTVADIVAEKLSILHLDTGAMYRAVALFISKKNIDVNNESVVQAELENLSLKIKFEEGKQRTFLGSDDVSEEIRRPEVSMLASNVSKLVCVRSKMVEMQQKIAQEMSCVLDGRDIGTCVLKNAPYKFFLTASTQVRAERRFLELKNKGFDVNFDELLKEIKERDFNDSNRSVSPLRKAEDAVLINSDSISANEAAEIILKEIKGAK